MREKMKTGEKENEAVESRQWLVEGLRRHLVGPLATGDSASLGYTNTPKVVPALETFKEDGKRDIGALLDSDGEEILRDPPLKVYRIGILNASKTSKEQDDDEDGGQDELDFGDKSKPRRKSKNDFVPDRDDDEEHDEEHTESNAVIGVTFRIPDFNPPVIELEFSAARYEHVSQYWIRRPIRWSVEADLGRGNQIFGIPVKDGCRAEAGLSIRHVGESLYCTVWAANRSDPASSNQKANERSLFQCRLVCSGLRELLPLPGAMDGSDLSLSYSDSPVYVAGHGCAATEYDGNTKVRTEPFPVVKVFKPDMCDVGVDFKMMDFAQMNKKAEEAVSALVEQYETWIGEQAMRADSMGIDGHSDYPDRQIRKQLDFLERIRQGWRLVNSDEDAGLCFGLANEAMALQRAAVQSKRRAMDSKHYPKIKELAGQARWRPFQMAFLLASIPSLLERKPEADVIWMPTGGGKTEAYFGLAAFAILHERLTLRKKGLRQCKGVKVLMRYTLRLLTSQQFQRASSLICALELIRRAHKEEFGLAPVSIGAWLGGTVTPNSENQALTVLKNALSKGMPVSRFLTTQCPWCGAEMDRQVDGSHLSGYMLDNQTLLPFCPDRRCPFGLEQSSGEGLPIHVVDDQIYAKCPDFIVATVDKTVRLAWRTDNAERLFGLAKGKNGEVKRVTNPPALFIQDELHLIEGPLGSIYGGLESVFESLCEEKDGTRPYVVASTATTRDCENQIRRLYGREACLVPPAGVSSKDNFFASIGKDSEYKEYVGFSPAIGTSEDNQRYPMSVIAYLVGVMRNRGMLNDPWWTNVAFFSSRWTLARLESSVDSKMRMDLRTLRRRTGLDSGLPKDGKTLASRSMSMRKEITAVATENVGATLNLLGVDNSAKNCVDLCYATSMIEVGLDVDRLGLMTVVGMPKNFSQYIQVTGRVGRRTTSPAIILVVHNRGNRRDQSYFESFIQNHDRLYAAVEATSVTPMAGKAVRRWLSTALTMLIRSLGAGRPGYVKEQAEEKAGYAKRLISGWFSSTVDDSEELERFQANLETEYSKLMNTLQHADDGIQWILRDGGSQFLRGYGDDAPAEHRDEAHWDILQSMRTVEGDAGFSPAVRSLRPVYSIQNHEDGEDEAW